MPSGILSVGRRRALNGLAALVMALAAALACAGGAHAETGPPVFRNGGDSGFGVEAYSTRVQIEGNLVEEGLPTEWHGEYAPSCTGPWTVVNGVAADAPEKTRVYIGEIDPLAFEGLRTAYLRHLTPETSYCVRFTAKNADGETTSETFPFRTLPVEKPEVPKKENSEFTPPDNGHPQYRCEVSSATAASCKAEIESNGAETSYSFEYAPAEPGGGRPSEASSSWKPFSSGATGAVSVAEDAADAGAQLTGLTPETIYYVRLKMRNSAGETVQTTYSENTNARESFTTPTARPVVDSLELRNVTASSAVAKAYLQAVGSETRWRFEYAQSVMGPWSLVPGGEGTISQAQAETRSYFQQLAVATRLTGLSAATTYYVRLFAENAAGEAKFCYGNVDAQTSCEAVSLATRVSEGFPATFETESPATITTFAVHALVGDQLRLIGGVNPKSTPTSSEQVITVEGAPTGGTFTLTFNGKTTEPLAYDAPAGEGEGSGSVGAALRAIAGPVLVEGPPGGPYTVLFVVGNAGVSQPQIECQSQLTPSGSCSVVTLLKGGEAPQTRYRFQYVSQASYGEHGWSGAETTPEVTAGSGTALEVVHAVLPLLPAGESYRYRLVATSSIPGVGLIEGPEQTFNVPSFSVSPTPSPCPNEAFRTGLSAHLPDCRAYELLTPVEKGSSLEPWTYGARTEASVHIGEDGNHLVVDGPAVHWASGDSPYFFAREAGKGWFMSSGSPQPATGIATHVPQLFSADLTQMAFESRYQPSEAASSELGEYFVGPAAGPYTKVASIPRDAGAEPGQWVATNASFSKLVLKSRDHSLLGTPTGTRSGYDLYEYTPGSGLRLMNVIGAGTTTIGSCGAEVARGLEGGAGSGSSTGALFAGAQSSLNTVSADGTRVFFYASAPRQCASEAELGIETSRGIGPNVNLYMRANGAETIDIGPYKFLGTNPQGTEVLLENSSREQFGYDTEAGTLQPQSSSEKEAAGEMALLGVPYQAEPRGNEPFFHARYTYFSQQANLPMKNGQGEEEYPPQVYRYDNVEHVVECISCASPYNPDPKLPAFLQSGFGENARSTIPLLRTYSQDGQFAFFTTTAALVPQDVDGEVSPEEYAAATGGIEVYNRRSPSSDVYEWRAAGVDGCEHVQGCLALITDGRGGYFSDLLGSAEEGHEVFIYTHSKLLPQDVDTAGDIYAVRVDGGFPPPPPRPTECEGDACANVPGAPNDATPSSLTFEGVGNVAVPPSGKAPMKEKQAKRTKRAKSKRSRRTHRRRHRRRRSAGGRRRLALRTGRRAK